MRPWSTLALLAVCLVQTATACRDNANISAAKAAEHAAMLADVAAHDVSEIERGLPQGAARLSALYAKGADPRQDLASVRAALARVRREIADLNAAKSTFFALADGHGVAIRNNLEQDVMAGQNLGAMFPDLTKALTTNAPIVTTGAFAQTASAHDRDWIAAVAVKGADGAARGLFVTGWSYRYFARHLQETLKRHLQDDLIKANDPGKLPVFYVALFDPSGVYGAPLTPAVNEEALVEADVAGRTASGPVHGVLTITAREFGYGAVRVPKLGAQIGIAVLRSEI